VRVNPERTGSGSSKPPIERRDDLAAASHRACGGGGGEEGTRRGRERRGKKAEGKKARCRKKHGKPGGKKAEGKKGGGEKRRKEKMHAGKKGNKKKVRGRPCDDRVCAHMYRTRCASCAGWGRLARDQDGARARGQPAGGQQRWGTRAVHARAHAAGHARTGRAPGPTRDGRR